MWKFWKKKKNPVESDEIDKEVWKMWKFWKKKKNPVESDEIDCTGKDGYGDYQQWLICKKKGHVAVCSFDDWLCLRCWTGWFMGMRFPIKEETRDAFRKPGLIKGNVVIGVSPKMFGGPKGTLHYAEIYDDTGKSPFIEGVKIISYDEAITMGENTDAPDKGGPPYVYELR